MCCFFFAGVQSVLVLSQHPLHHAPPLPSLTPGLWSHPLFLLRCGPTEGPGDHPVQHGGWCPNLHRLPASHHGSAQHPARNADLPAAGSAPSPGPALVLVLVLVLSSFHPLVCSVGPSRRRTDSPWHDGDPNADPADGTNGEDHTKDTPSGSAR